MKRSFLIPIIFAVCAGVFMAKISFFLGPYIAHLGFGDVESNAFAVLGFLLLLYLFCICLWGKFRVYRAESKALEVVKRITLLQRRLFKDEDIPDRLTVNAALDKAVESKGEDIASLELVLRFATRIEPVFEVKGSQQQKKQRKNMRGLTNVGEFEFKEEAESESKLAAYKTRIGQYKMWRDLRVIFFQHYWIADIETSVNPLDAYRGYAILFDPSTFGPVGFGELDYELVRTGVMFRTEYVLLFIRVLTGELKDTKIPFGLLTIK